MHRGEVIPIVNWPDIRRVDFSRIPLRWIVECLSLCVRRINTTLLRFVIRTEQF